MQTRSKEVSCKDKVLTRPASVLTRPATVESQLPNSAILNNLFNPTIHLLRLSLEPCAVQNFMKQDSNKRSTCASLSSRHRMKEDAPSLVVSYHLSKLNKGCQPVKEKMSTSLALCKESNNSCSSRTRRVELLAHCEAPHGCAGEAITFGKQLKRVVVNPDFLSSEDEKSVQHKTRRSSTSKSWLNSSDGEGDPCPLQEGSGATQHDAPSQSNNNTMHNTDSTTYNHDSSQISNLSSALGTNSDGHHPSSPFDFGTNNSNFDSSSKPSPFSSGANNSNFDSSSKPSPFSSGANNSNFDSSSKPLHSSSPSKTEVPEIEKRKPLRLSRRLLRLRRKQQLEDQLESSSDDYENDHRKCLQQDRLCRGSIVMPKKPSLCIQQAAAAKCEDASVVEKSKKGTSRRKWLNGVAMNSGIIDNIVTEKAGVETNSLSEQLEKIPTIKIVKKGTVKATTVASKRAPVSITSTVSSRLSLPASKVKAPASTKKVSSAKKISKKKPSLVKTVTTETRRRKGITNAKTRKKKQTPTKKVEGLVSTEDSGYPHSLSGSDASVRVPDFNSPATIQLNEEGEGAVAPCLVQTNVHSNGVEDQNPHLDCNIINNPILGLTAISEESGMYSLFRKTSGNSELQGDGIVYPDLEELLNQNVNPADLLCKAGENSGGGSNMDVYSMESILDTEGISDWLKKLEVSPEALNYNPFCDLGSIVSLDPPPPIMGAAFHTMGFENEQSPAVNVAAVVTVESEEVEPVPPMESSAGASPNILIKRRRGRPRKRPIAPIEDIPVKKKVKLDKVNSLIGVESRTKYGRVCKPSQKVRSTTILQKSAPGGISKRPPADIQSASGSVEVPVLLERDSATEKTSVEQVANAESIPAASQTGLECGSSVLDLTAFPDNISSNELDILYQTPMDMDLLSILDQSIGDASETADLKGTNTATPLFEIKVPETNSDDVLGSTEKGTDAPPGSSEVKDGDGMCRSTSDGLLSGSSDHVMISEKTEVETHKNEVIETATALSGDLPPSVESVTLIRSSPEADKITIPKEEETTKKTCVVIEQSYDVLAADEGTDEDQAKPPSAKVEETGKDRAESPGDKGSSTSETTQVEETSVLNFSRDVTTSMRKETAEEMSVDALMAPESNLGAAHACQLGLAQRRPKRTVFEEARKGSSRARKVIRLKRKKSGDSSIVDGPVQEPSCVCKEASGPVNFFMQNFRTPNLNLERVASSQTSDLEPVLDAGDLEQQDPESGCLPLPKPLGDADEAAMEDPPSCVESCLLNSKAIDVTSKTAITGTVIADDSVEPDRSSISKVIPPSSSIIEEDSCGNAAAVMSPVKGLRRQLDSDNDMQKPAAEVSNLLCSPVKELRRSGEGGGKILTPEKVLRAKKKSISSKKKKLNVLSARTVMDKEWISVKKEHANDTNSQESRDQLTVKKKKKRVKIKVATASAEKELSPRKKVGSTSFSPESKQLKTDRQERASSSESVRNRSSISPGPADSKESMDEDCIDLHAEDDDMFPADISEDPLARIFPKFKTPSGVQSVTPASPYKCPNSRLRTIPSKEHLSTPVRQRLGLTSSPSPMLPLPGMDLNPHADTNSSNNLFPVRAHQMCVAPPPCSTGGLLSRSARLKQAAFNNNNNDVSTHSSPMNNPNPFIASALPLSPEVKRSSSRNVPLTKVCHSYLKGRCSYGERCKYVHMGRNVVPLSTLEEVVLSQPINFIPPDVVNRYVYDHYSSSLLENHFPVFVAMIHCLLKKDFNGVLVDFNQLSSMGVNFSIPFLSHLLELCATHYQCRQMIMKYLKETMSQISPENYLQLFRAMAEYNMITELKELYVVMKQKKSGPNMSILMSLLRYKNKLDEWVFQILEDVKLCETGDGNESRFINLFLDTVDYQLLTREHNLQRVVQYLDSSALIAGKLTSGAFSNLCGAFTSCQLWDKLESLLHNYLRLIPSIRTTICEPLELVIRHLGVSEKIMVIMERLTEEQKAGLSIEVWNKVMLMCAQKGRSQRATKFYNIITKLSKQLSSDVMLLLAELFKKHHNTSVALMVLRDGLQRVPPIIPPLPLLTALTSSLDILNSFKDLQLIITSLINNKIGPPLRVLQSLFTFCSKEKCYSKLVEVVRLARDCGVVLDRSFYRSVLEVLQQWGQDQDAISIAMQALEQEGVDGSGNGDSEKKTNETTLLRSDSKRKMLISNSKSAPPPPPPPVASIAETTTSSQSITLASVPLERHTEAPVTMEQGGDSLVPSLEDVIERSPKGNIHELLKLIESNGRLGQFRAVASILVDMESTASHYTQLLVFSIWEAITSSKMRTANAFSSLLSHIDQCRQTNCPSGSSSSSHPTSPGSYLLSTDRWLFSQLAIALLILYEESKDWQSAFVILHQLHRFGVHYIKLSQPPSSLPPLLPRHPSPCSVALMAVNVCLCVSQDTNSALEVFRGCNWIQASNESELHRRTEVIAALAQRCLDAGLLEDAKTCLTAISSGELLRKYVHLVTNLHNKLLQGILDSKNVELSLSVFGSMKECDLQCLPSVFSGLLQALCETNQASLAREFCENAIKTNCYVPLTKGDVFEVTLPLGLMGLELQLLLEHHLISKVAPEVKKGYSRNLVIHMSAGSHDVLERVLTGNFPTLSAKFEGRLVTIACHSLQQWFTSHGTKQESSDNVRSLGKLLAVSVEVSPMDIKSAEDDKISPEFSFVRTGAGTD